MHVGGENDEFEFLLAGQPFNDLEKCVKLSDEGEVVISRDAWHLVSSHASGRALAKSKTNSGEVLVTGLERPVLAQRLLPLPREVFQSKHLARACRAYLSQAVRFTITLSDRPYNPLMLVILYTSYPHFCSPESPLHRCWRRSTTDRRIG